MRTAMSGLIFFPMEVGHPTNKKICFIVNEHGGDGYWVWSCLVSYAYQKNGYYLDASMDTIEHIAANICRRTPEFVLQIIQSCLRRKLFDKHLFDKHQILTSRRMQGNFIHGTYDRRRKGTTFTIPSKYFLLNKDDLSKFSDAYLDRIIFADKGTNLKLLKAHSAEHLLFSAEERGVGKSTSVEKNSNTDNQLFTGPEDSPRVPEREASGKNSKKSGLDKSDNDGYDSLSSAENKSSSPSDSYSALHRVELELDKYTNTNVLVPEPNVSGEVVRDWDLTPPKNESELLEMKAAKKKSAPAAAKKSPGAKISSSKFPDLHLDSCWEIFKTFTVERKGVAPFKTGVAMGKIRELMCILKKRCEDAQKEWSEPEAKSRWMNFISSAYQLEWLESHWTLGIICQQKELVFQHIVNPSNNGTSKNGSTHAVNGTATAAKKKGTSDERMEAIANFTIAERPTVR